MLLPVSNVKQPGQIYRQSNLRRIFKVPPVVRWSHLRRILPSDVDIDVVRKAYDFAKFLHRGQKRYSGEDFIHHPLAVAYLVTKLGLDQDAIVAALLHDVLEDNTVGVTKDILKRYFGNTVTFLVCGLTNFKGITARFSGNQDSIPDLRKLLLASASDVRIVILRLADKVHNAWTASFLPVEKQIRLAKRALTIYAPIAHFVGLSAFRRELEEAAFYILYPETFDWLQARMSFVYDVNLDLVIQQLEDSIRDIGKFKVVGRRKSLWSTYQKILRYLKEDKGEEVFLDIMQKPLNERLYYLDLSFQKIRDIIGVMILTKTVDEVYAVVKRLKKVYGHRPEYYDDYIKNPKPSGYRSIHMVVPMKTRSNGKIRQIEVEVQVKTELMHEYNEFGPASHLAYKWGSLSSGIREDYSWVKDLVRWTKDKKRYKLQIFKDYVFVLTPEGEVVKLPTGASPVDMLFMIDKTSLPKVQGVYINGKRRELSARLKTGDVVSFVLDPFGVFISENLLKAARLPSTREYLKRLLEVPISTGRISKRDV